MKIYNVEITKYPREYRIEAETEEQAREQAKQKFYNETGAGAYEITSYEE